MTPRCSTKAHDATITCSQDDALALEIGIPDYASAIPSRK